MKEFSRGSGQLLRLFSFVLLAGLAPGAIAASVSQQAGSYLRLADHRVAKVAYRVATGAVRHCAETAPVVGLALDHAAEYSPADRPSLIERRRLDLGPGIVSVVDGSPGAEAGLVAGDVILSVNERRIYPDDSSSVSAAAARTETGELMEKQLRLGPVRLRVLRSGQELGTVLGSRLGCPARVRLARSREAAAVSGDGQIVLTTGALMETRSDDELAVIVGHELAHIVLKHGERLRAQRVPRGLLRELGKNAARVLATEREADRLGIKLAAAAGYDMRAAIPFWRRFYARYDGPRLFRTHPSLAERERIIRETLAELEHDEISFYRHCEKRERRSNPVCSRSVWIASPSAREDG
jgi:hypothetical protein